MNEVKNNNARKPLIYYYIIALLIMMLLNFLLFPSVLRRQEVQVDYSTFMSDLEDGKISQVEVQDQQIEYLLKDENNDWTVYITGNMGDPELVNRLEEADGATRSWSTGWKRPTSPTARRLRSRCPR